MSTTTTTTGTTTSTPLPSTLSHLLNVIVEWLAGELAGNPTLLKLAGLAAIVAGALPGDLSSTLVRTVLIAAGAFLAAVVHLAEAKPKP